MSGQLSRKSSHSPQPEYPARLHVRANYVQGISVTYRISTGFQARQTAYHADPTGWREMAGTVHKRALALSFDVSQAESDDTTMFKLRMVGMTPLCFFMRGRLFVH